MLAGLQRLPVRRETALPRFCNVCGQTLQSGVVPAKSRHPVNTFTCSQCHQTVFFENVRCESCGSALGFVPTKRAMFAFEADDHGPWRVAGQATGESYRPCRNYRVENICNWMLPANSTDEYCASCRLTEIIPTLNKPESKHLWFRLEQAKRRLIYSLQGLQLPLHSRAEDPHYGLAFQFLEDTPGDERIVTGHDGRDEV